MITVTIHEYLGLPDSVDTMDISTICFTSALDAAEWLESQGLVVLSGVEYPTHNLVTEENSRRNLKAFCHPHTNRRIWEAILNRVSKSEENS